MKELNYSKRTLGPLYPLPSLGLHKTPYDLFLPTPVRICTSSSTSPPFQEIPLFSDLYLLAALRTLQCCQPLIGDLLFPMGERDAPFNNGFVGRVERTSWLTSTSPEVREYVKRRLYKDRRISVQSAFLWNLTREAGEFWMWARPNDRTAPVAPSRFSSPSRYRDTLTDLQTFKELLNRLGLLPQPEPAAPPTP